MEMQERNAAIYAMYQDGMRQVDIAKRFGLVQSNISTIIKNERAKAKDNKVSPVKKPWNVKVKDLVGNKEDLSPVERSNRIYNSELNYVRVGYKQGLTVQQMASALRTNTTEVQEYIRRI